MRDAKGHIRSAVLSLAGKQYSIISTVTSPGLYLDLKSFRISVLCTSCSTE